MKEEDMSNSCPSELVQGLSRQKAEDVAGQLTGPVMVIGSDTIVVCNNEILGKPKSVDDAFRMIRQLQDNYNEVYTGVTVIVKETDGSIREHTFYEVARVWIEKMTEQEIWQYIATEEPMDKAGAYAIQGKFACYVKRIEGDFYTIVGLPIAHLYQVIKDMNEVK
jgi:septum formation protein